jgi:hypothetical protein
MKPILATLLLLLASVSLSSAAVIKPPQGFDGKVYAATQALYGSSASVEIKDRFICTVTAFRKVTGGYLLIGAGHCTSANPDLPADLTFSVSSNLGESTSPVTLLQSAMAGAADYAVYFYPTAKKIPTIALCDDCSARVGDKTVDVNFSLGVGKFVGKGVIDSVILNGDLEGFFGVEMFGTHGASGSAVVSKKSHRILGLLIAGFDGATMPVMIEPIVSIKASIEQASTLRKAASTSASSNSTPQITEIMEITSLFAHVFPIEFTAGQIAQSLL